MRILILDIETSPMIAFMWKMWRENVGLNQLIANSYIIGFAAKWHGEKEIIYDDLRGASQNDRRKENDKRLVGKLAALLDEADAVVAHNGRDFDLRVIQARMFNYAMDPPSSYRTIDTKLVAVRNFRLPSYKLEYLTDKFNKKYKKLKHEKFPGFELWKETIWLNNPAAWEEMEKYNKYDVLATEELYFGRMVDWDSSINFYAYQDACICGSYKHKKRGFARLNGGTYQRYKCLNCGREFRDTKSLSRAKFVPTQRNN